VEFVAYNGGGFSGVVAPRWKEVIERWQLGARTIRTRPQREILRLEAGLIAKVYFNIPGLFGRLFPVGGWQASREFTNLVSAARRGIPVPEAAGLIRDRSRGVVFVEEMSGSRTLEAVLEFERRMPKARAELLTAVGTSMKAAMESGLYHPDLHAGNLLIRGDSIWYVDLPAARVMTKAVAGDHRLRMLSAMAGSLERIVNLTDLARLFQAASCTSHREWRSICDLISRMRARHAASRARHSLRGGADCKRTAMEGWTVVARRHVNPGDVSRALQGAQVIPRRRAERLWNAAMQLKYRLVPGRDFDLIAWRRNGAMLVPTESRDSRSLDEFLSTDWKRLDSTRRRDAILRCAAFLRRTHELGVGGIGELRVEDRPDGRSGLWISGLDDLRFYAKAPFRVRRKDLHCLADRYGVQLSRTERLRFQRAYGLTADR